MPESNRKDRPATQRVAILGAVISIPLLLLVATLLVARGFDHTAMLRREVIRSHEARAELRRILSLHQDLETGQRGFLIAGDVQFLAPYAEAARQIDPAFIALEEKLPESAEYRSRIRELRRASLAKRRFVERSIAVAKGGNIGSGRQLVASGEGKRLMDRVRDLIARFAEHERVELERATATSEAARIALRNESFALQGILLLLLAGAGLWVARSNAARDRARRRSDDLAARQEAIFDSAKDGMIVINRSGSIESLNPAAARMFGHERRTLARRDIGNLFEVAPDRGQVEGFLSRLQARRNGTAGEVQEFIGRRSDGSSFPLEVSVSVVPLADTTVFLAVCRDISERRKIEEIKGEFVATVSHELRTPLTSIAGSLGLITGGAAGQIPAKALRLVQIAQSNSTRLVRLINDILDIEKIEAGRMPFDIRPVALDGVLRAIVSDHAGFAAEYHVRIDLMAIPPGAVVLADEDRLAQVITNLLSNAIKFSPREGTVRVCVVALDRRFRISVSDEGDGVPEAFRERIFEKFTQADNSDSRQKGGTGLGLSIVREIVTRLGGSVHYDGKAGTGATFHVDLPAPQRIATPDPVVTTTDTTGLPAILHVDDDPDMLRVLSSVFEGKAALYSTPSLEEARMAAGRGGFDAAILDIGLADGNGLELVSLLRARDPSIPITVFSAQEIDPSQAAGVDLVMVKSRASMDSLVEQTMDMIARRKAAAAP